MSIKDFTGKIKSFHYGLKDKAKTAKSSLKIGEDMFIIIIIFFVGLISFGLGRLSTYEKKNTASASEVSVNMPEISENDPLI